MCESNVVFQFAERFSCKLNITKEAGHYFHAPTELASLNNWLEKIMLTMKKEILFVLLNEFADTESAYIASLLNFGLEPGKAKYTVKTLSVTKEPIVSMGGFRVLPDYDLQDVPDDYAGLVLIGGMSWFTPEAEQLVSLVKTAIENQKVVAGICNASVFLGAHGFLNNVKHTSNGLEYLKQYAGINYTGDANYIDQQGVRDGNIVTSGGLNTLEFSREVLYALDVDTPEQIEKSYQMHKTGTWML